MRHARWWVALVPALALGACAHASPARPGAGAGDAATIRAATETYLAAWNAADVNALAGLLAEDGVVIAPDGGTSEGRDAYRRAASEYFHGFAASQAGTVSEVSIQGDVAVTRGTWSIRETPRRGGEAQVRSGHWLAVQKRQADGSWQAWRLIFSQAPASGAAAAPAASAPPAGSPQDPEAEIGALLASYNAAINARDDARVRVLFPSLSAAGFRDLMRMRTSDVVQITLIPGTVRPVGAGSAVEAQVSATIVPAEGIGETRQLVYTLDRNGRGWHIASVRRAAR